ncbi:heavy-metal-associated domain-containing protein [bacterium]|nr:heavy-metal-associated domain-containing protein [bacterium]MBU1983175.1 heavy-metal-associated domain-containing protein [bacterium]
MYFITLHFVDKIDRRFFRRTKVSAKAVEIEIEGMTCSHCVKTVTDALKSVPGVTNADVNLATGRAQVEGENLDRNALKKAVESVGYKTKTEKPKS